MIGKSYSWRFEFQDFTLRPEYIIQLVLYDTNVVGRQPFRRCVKTELAHECDKFFVGFDAVKVKITGDDGGMAKGRKIVCNKLNLFVPRAV